MAPQHFNLPGDKSLDLKLDCFDEVLRAVCQIAAGNRRFADWEH
jgi:hypothetical protein